MNKSDINAWLVRDDSDLVNTIVTDVERHVASLRSNGDVFYGYAVLPGDYCTQPDPASIVVAFNRESDIRRENAQDVYYRYSVDEWQNYIHDGFDATNSLLKTLFDEFKQLHVDDPNNFQLDDTEVAYVAKINNAILNAMKTLKSNGTFETDTFVTIWFSDADYDIIIDSARMLNTPEIFEQFSSEFA
ncbi:MAG: DUF4303 domain-containing protein [Pirellulaceae bacterium]